MSDEDVKQADRRFDRGDAAHTVLSLSQALLAPLDAILKAQVHAARSFVNFLLQLGYPHQPVTQTAGTPAAERGRNEADNESPYRLDFVHDVPGGGKQTISIPTLALVPVAPLGVSAADFQFDFHIRQIARHRQIMASEAPVTEQERKSTAGRPETQVDRFTRPWFLVDTPLSLQGTFAPASSSAPVEAGDPTTERSGSSETRLQIQVKVAALPVPPALEKLLAGLAQVTTVEDRPAPPRAHPPLA